jgi:S-methylmethionine-dependent homocysteine/selenocysteine methylase
MTSCVSPEIYEGVHLSLKNQNLTYGFAVNAFIDIPDIFKLGENFSSQPNTCLGLRDELTPKVFTQFAINSFNKGAKFLKGCCNIKPKHIKLLNKTL